MTFCTERICRKWWKAHRLIGSESAQSKHDHARNVDTELQYILSTLYI